MFASNQALRICLLIGVCLTCAVGRAEPFEAFLTKHCLSCHGPDKSEGDLRLDRLSRDFRSGQDTHHWAEALDKVNTGEMPPPKQAQPTQAEISAFVLSLDTRLKEGRAARMAARPPVTHYRLSRKEYQNTVYDLLGVRYDPTRPGELNEDTRWHGFERLGSELSLSPSHIDRYYRAAGIVLDRAFPTTTSEARLVRKTAVDLRYSGSKDVTEALARFKIERPLRYLLFPGRLKRPVALMVRQDGTGAQRALSRPLASQWHPPARRPTCAFEHRHHHRRRNCRWSHRVRFDCP